MGSVRFQTEPNRTEPNRNRFGLDFSKSRSVPVRFGSRLFRFRFGSVWRKWNYQKIKIILYRTSTNKEKKKICSMCAIYDESNTFLSCLYSCLFYMGSIRLKKIRRLKSELTNKSSFSDDLTLNASIILFNSILN